MLRSHTVLAASVTPVRLKQPPALESWDATGHPSQQRLRAYLDSVTVLVGPALAEDAARLPLALDVAVCRPAHPADLDRAS
ncbi:MAG: hypothetical protein HOV84_10470 [Streptomyces sp.]|nr:hypothetical protein [Streptomyces sp.]